MSALSSILVVLSVGLASLMVGYLLGWSRGWMACLQAVHHWLHSAHVGKTGGGHGDVQW